MTGKSTYADLVKKNVDSVSPEPTVDQPAEQIIELSQTKIIKSKPKKSEKANTNNEQQTIVNGVNGLTNGHSSPTKSASPVLVKENPALLKTTVVDPEVELEDNTGFKLVKGRERKHSNSSRQSSYRNSSGRPGLTNRKKSESRVNPGKKQSFDERRDEEKLKYLNRFPKKDKLCFSLKSGDVFSAEPNVSLAHCVSEDFNPVDGVGKEFKERFGNTANLLAQNIKTGGCANIEIDGRHVFYLVTRQFGYHRPYYSSLEKSLKELRKQCIALEVSELSMPLIGNRQDQLDWDVVSLILDKIFNETEINLTVFKYKSERKKPPVERNRSRIRNTD